jgi:hypothetical protein
MMNQVCGVEHSVHKSLIYLVMSSKFKLSRFGETTIIKTIKFTSNDGSPILPAQRSVLFGRQASTRSN